MTRMAATPIYGKNPSKYLLRNQRANGLGPWYVALGPWAHQSLFKWWPFVYLDLFCGKVKFGPLCFYLGKSVRKTFNGRNLQQMTRVTWGICLHKKFWHQGVEVMFLKLATNGHWDKAFLLTSGRCPQRVVCPSTGLYTCGKHLKMCIKSEFRDLFETNGRSNKGFLLTSKVCPEGVSALVSGLYTGIESLKMYIKSDFEAIILELATYGQREREKAFLLPFCCHQNFVPKGLSAPTLGLYTCIKALKYIPGTGVRWAFAGPRVLWFTLKVDCWWSFTLFP